MGKGENSGFLMMFSKDLNQDLRQDCSVKDKNVPL